MMWPTGSRHGFSRGEPSITAFTVEAFHAKIAEISGFPGIWRQVLQVKVQVDRYRRLTLVQEGRMAQVIADHERIMEGISLGSPPDAQRAMEAHLDAVLPQQVTEEHEVVSSA